MNATNTITITLDDNTIELFRHLEASTGTAASDVIRKLIGAHVAELCEVAEFLEQLQKDSPLRSRAKHLFDNFGPNSLIDDMKELDPTYKTMGDRFRDELRQPVEVRA